MDGAVLTMWSRSAGSSLWGYYIDDSNNFGDLRNWNIREGTRPGTIQFENKEIGTCMTSFNGFKEECNYLLLHVLFHLNGLILNYTRQ